MIGYSRAFNELYGPKPIERNNKMNERINQLIKQSYVTVQSQNDREVTYFSQEKFAELIVRECMSTVLKESKWYWDKDEFESSNAIQNAARRLKEHFGVEE